MDNKDRKYFSVMTLPSVILDMVDQENRPLKLEPDGHAEFLTPTGKKVGKYRKLTYEQMRAAVGWID